MSRDLFKVFCFGQKLFYLSHYSCSVAGLFLLCCYVLASQHVSFQVTFRIKSFRALMTKVFLLHLHFFTSDKACKPGVCCHPLTCFSRSSFLQHLKSQYSQVFSGSLWRPLRDFTCVSKWPLCWNVFPHSPHSRDFLIFFGFSLCTLCTRLVCLLRLALSLVSYGHSSHLWVLFSLITAVLCFLMWLSKIFFPITVSPQFSHVYEFVCSHLV